MVAIIDYDAGNIKSVQKAIEFLGHEVEITRDKDKILEASHVILPGVGAFGDAMSKLQNYDLVSTIKDVIDNDTPFLGICLGLQLLFETSEESPGVQGLGVFKGCIKRIPDNGGVKIPHIGWNLLRYPKAGKLYHNLKEDSYVYFVHSYYLEAEDEDIVVATTDYGVKIHASVEKGNVYACQFHPEKSSATGLTILKSFLNIQK